MRMLIPILAMLVSGFCYAEPSTGPGCEGCGTWNDYHAEDKFQWRNPKTVQHVAVGYGIAISTSMILIHKFDMAPLPAAIIGTFASGVLSTFREMNQDFVSKSDLQEGWLGAAMGGVMTYAISF